MLIRRLLVIVALCFLMWVAVITPANSAAETKTFIFGLLLVGPHDDHGLSQTHYEGGKYVVEKVHRGIHRMRRHEDDLH